MSIIPARSADPSAPRRDQPGPGSVVVALHLLAAAALRELASRHWRQIDWLQAGAPQPRRST